MLNIKCYEEPNTYLFTVSNGDNSLSFDYRWGKGVSQNQTLDEYLQICKQEALLLAENEIAQSQPAQEITI